MTKVKASCFVLVVDRNTSSLHRKDDFLAIAPDWELDHGVVRIIEMKTYKNKKISIVKPTNITSPLLARFSSTYRDYRIAIAGQLQQGPVEIWDWQEDRGLQQFQCPCSPTGIDFTGNDVLLGDGLNWFNFLLG